MDKSEHDNAPGETQVQAADHPAHEVATPETATAEDEITTLRTQLQEKEAEAKARELQTIIERALHNV